jgi:hypothetical protein
MPAHLRNPAAEAKVRHGNKFFLIPFFIFHYGIFCFGHGVFVYSLLANNGDSVVGNPLTGLGIMVTEILRAGGKVFVLAIVASHLWSFYFNYLGKGEFRRTTAPVVTMAPYDRIIVLHLAILFGAIVITALGSQVFLLILLIVGKIMLDAKLHQRSHEKLLSESVPS